jgi:protoporphyrinogen oxidase
VSDKPIIVVGSGPSGLMQALYLARVRNRQVAVVEQQPAIGGLFASARTPWGLVDQGVHLIQETGRPEWDELLFEILPLEEWQVLEGVRKDIAGNIFEGQLNTGSLYPDLRRLPREDHLRCIGEMYSNLSCSSPHFSDVPNLAVYFERRFGAYATQRVFQPIANKLWRRPLEQLSPWAAKIVHLTRVVTHDAEVSLSLKASPALDSLLGFPEQLKCPQSLLSNRRRALYPRRYGLSHVVDGLRRTLERHGVQFLTSTRVANLEIAGGRIAAAHLTAADGGASQRIEAEALLWTSPLFELSQHLGLHNAHNAPPPDAPLPHRVVYLFLDKPALMEELYWLWSYDPQDSLVRVSNPAAYCPDAAASGVYPLCIEMHVREAKTADAAVAAQAEGELRMRGLIGRDTTVVGSHVLPGGRGFIVPTLQNAQALSQQRNAIAAAAVDNLFLFTQDISAGIFYLPEILNASLARLDAL